MGAHYAAIRGTDNDGVHSRMGISEGLSNALHLEYNRIGDAWIRLKQDKTTMPLGQLGKVQVRRELWSVRLNNGGWKRPAPLAMLWHYV